MLFLNHFKGSVIELAAIRLSDFLEVVMSDDRCNQYGWTEEVLRIAHQFKSSYPGLQFKVAAKMRTLIESPTHRGRFEIIFTLPGEERKSLAGPG